MWEGAWGARGGGGGGGTGRANGALRANKGVGVGGGSELRSLTGEHWLQPSGGQEYQVGSVSDRERILGKRRVM